MSKILSKVTEVLHVTVTMHKDKEEGQYRGRGDLSVYDHSLLDGDMFLQVYYIILYSIFIKRLVIVQVNKAGRD